MRSLDRLLGDLTSASSTTARLLEQKKYGAARDEVRAIMRAASQLLPRLQVLSEMEDDLEA